MLLNVSHERARDRESILSAIASMSEQERENERKWNLSEKVGESGKKRVREIFHIRSMWNLSYNIKFNYAGLRRLYRCQFFSDGKAKASICHVICIHCHFQQAFFAPSFFCFVLNCNISDEMSTQFYSELVRLVYHCCRINQVLWKNLILSLHVFHC